MAQRRELRCLIAAGGTAGHVLPSLAVAEALQERGVIVTFAGPRDRGEERLVAEAGFEFDPFRVTGFSRKPGLKLVRGLVVAAKAVRACGRILRSREPDVVLGGGGHVAGPMVMAASGQSIPAALMEADAQLGLANRLAAPFAKRIFLSFPIEGRGRGKYRVTGRPIPARSRPVPRADARRLFELPEESQVLLVLGGSQGARSLNELAVSEFGEAGPAVLHLAGDRDYESLRPHVGRDDYRLLPFTDDFGAALAAADLALSRSGGVVWELAAAGLPAVLVPYPHATADHQMKNARYFEAAGGAVVVPESELDRAPSVVRELLADAATLERMREAMLGAARPDAATEIAEELIGLARA